MSSSSPDVFDEESDAENANGWRATLRVSIDTEVIQNRTLDDGLPETLALAYALRAYLDRTGTGLLQRLAGGFTTLLDGTSHSHCHQSCIR